MLAKKAHALSCKTATYLCNICDLGLTQQQFSAATYETLIARTGPQLMHSFKEKQAAL